MRSSFRAKLFAWTFSFLKSTKQAPVKLEVCMCRVSSWSPLISWGMASIKQEERGRPLLNVTQSGRKESVILLAKLNRILFLRPALSLGQKQTDKSMEQNRQPKNKPTHLWSINLCQRRQKYTPPKKKKWGSSAWNSSAWKLVVVHGKLDSYMQKG